MATATTRKETIEYDSEFLDSWNQFCGTKGYSKRQASHAANLAFMGLGPEEREVLMADAHKFVTNSKQRIGPRKKSA